MKLTTENQTLRVSGLHELNEDAGDAIVHALRGALTPAHTAIEFDLAQLSGGDCDVVDVLLAIHEEFHQEDEPLTWRLANPPPELRQLCELMRLHHLFEITPPRPANLILL